MKPQKIQMVNRGMKVSEDEMRELLAYALIHEDKHKRYKIFLDNYCKKREK